MQGLLIPKFFAVFMFYFLLLQCRFTKARLPNCLRARFYVEGATRSCEVTSNFILLNISYISYVTVALPKLESSIFTYQSNAEEHI